LSEAHPSTAAESAAVPLTPLQTYGGGVVVVLVKVVVVLQARPKYKQHHAFLPIDQPVSYREYPASQSYGKLVVDVVVVDVVVVDDVIVDDVVVNDVVDELVVKVDMVNVLVVEVQPRWL